MERVWLELEWDFWSCTGRVALKCQTGMPTVRPNIKTEPPEEIAEIDANNVMYCQEKFLSLKLDSQISLKENVIEKQLEFLMKLQHCFTKLRTVALHIFHDSAASYFVAYKFISQ